MPRENDDGVDSFPCRDAAWEHEPLAKVTVKVFYSSASPVNSVSFCSGDSRFVSCSDDGAVQLWDISSGSHVKNYEGHTKRVSQCKASHDGKLIVSTSWNKKILLWDMETGRIIWSNSHIGMATCCSFSYDDKFVISGCDLDNSISIWSTTDGALVHKMTRFRGTINSCSFSRHHYRFCATSMDNHVRVIDMRNYVDEIDPRLLLAMRGHNNVISNADFSCDDRFLAVSSWDKSISLWDINAGSFRTSGPSRLTRGHDGCISACRFSQDGSVIVSSSYDSTLAIWDTWHGFKKFSLQGHSGWVTDCDISRDQSWVLSSGKDRTIRCWNISKSDEIPIVAQKRRTIGLNVFRCESCHEEFSTAHSQDSQRETTCVFCRLKRPSDVYTFIEAS